MLPFTVGAIAVGERYVAWSKLLVETLRRNGGYPGDVYIATDLPYAYAGLPGVHPVRVAAGRDAMAAKQHKATILDWVPGERVVYLDVDVVIGGPLAPWWSAVDGFWEKRRLATFRERTMPEPFHAGVMIFDRAASRPIAERWGEAIRSGMQRDQAALATVATADDVLLMPDEHLHFPTRETYRTGRRATFVHVTFTGRQLQVPPSTIAGYLRRSFGARELPMSASARADARWWIDHLAPRKMVTRAGRWLRNKGLIR